MKTQELLDIAVECGARDGRKTVDDRARLLTEALKRRAKHARIEVVNDVLEVLVRDADGRWTEHRVTPEYPQRGADQERDVRTSLEDATVVGIADILEAKYRADMFYKQQARGLPDDPSVFHDAVDLAFRTWSESLAISIRSQRSMIRALRRILPSERRRPAPRVWISGVVRLRRDSDKGREVWSGRFQVRNDRGTVLRQVLRPKVSSGNVQVSPSELRLEPGEQIHVAVSITPDQTADAPTEITWDDPECVLMPVAIEPPPPLPKPPGGAPANWADGQPPDTTSVTTPSAQPAEGAGK